MSLELITQELRELREEVVALRAALAPRLRAGRVSRAGMTATEAAETLGMGRKTFYARNISALLTREKVTGKFTRRSVELLRAKMEGNG